MKNFPFEPEVTQMACAVLRSLALGVPENKVSIVAQGGVRQLCEAMARHRTDADVNMQAIAALCNLTSHFAEHKRAICEAGGLELTVAALLLHPQHEELQQQGVRVEQWMKKAEESSTLGAILGAHVAETDEPGQRSARGREGCFKLSRQNGPMEGSQGGTWRRRSR